MQLEFYGAAGEVTGSCHVIEVGGRRVLLDCGLIQGGRHADERNREAFPFEPRSVDAVILSHAHIDHCGRVPLLMKRGFDGPVHATAACRDLCRILLADSAYLAEREARRENERRRTESFAPLYTVEEAKQAVGSIRTLRYDAPQEVLPGVELTFRDAGHILGSACVELRLREGAVERRVVFSGDLGQYGSPILRDPADMGRADLVIMESTYGDRLHRDRAATLAELGAILRSAADDHGNVLIPAFAVGRTQEILYLFGQHFDEWGLDRWQIFLDSPLAIEASEIYWQHSDLYDEEALRVRREFRGMPKLPNVHLTRTADESRAINRIRSGAIVIAGSGMCNGGRIVHHLKRNLWRSECHVIFTGFQARGTPGRAIVDGSASIRLHGEEVRVAAGIHTVGGLSAHGDQKDLLHWYESFDNRPPVWLVHGEPAASDAFAARCSELGIVASVAQRGERLDLANLPVPD